MRNAASPEKTDLGATTKSTESSGPVPTRVFDLCDAARDRYPSRPAIVYLGQEFTYARLGDLIDRFGAALRELGVSPRERAVLYIGNSPQWIIAYLGLQKIGAVPVPVSPLYTAHELAHMVETARAETIISGDTNFGYAAEVLRRSPTLRRIIVSNMADLLPRWKRAVGRILDRVPRGGVERRPEVHPFRRLLRSSAGRPAVRVGPTDLAHILFTGGTTGLPKGIAHTHGFLVAGYLDILNRYASEVGEAQHTFVFAGPLFHMFWQDMYFAAIAYRANSAVLLPRGVSADAILDSVQRYRATLFAGVPTLYRNLLDNDRFDLYDLHSLRYCWSAGDLLPTEIYHAWKEKVGVPIHQVYGSTEMVVYAVSSLDEADPAPPYVGMRMASRTFRLVDPENLGPPTHDGTGELLCRSDAMPTEYLGAVEESGDAFVELEGHRWFRTGDFVRLEDGGRVFFLDRAADVIKHKGYRVTASGVESVLQDHPAVRAACVIGIPDERAGERVKAFVVLKEDVRGIAAADLLRWCRGRLLPYEVPDYIEFRDALPKSKVGKLLRREMRDEELRRMAKS
jgi:long-chain acyl-CoA synthetase